jgi:hypothetical protein
LRRFLFAGIRHVIIVFYDDADWTATS